MKERKKPRLTILDTFKTKNQELTGEAIRQRSILVVLATQKNPANRTRTAISQRIAIKKKTIWKNIYSGVFRDIVEILIPLNLVVEEGRLPLKRGPKALQEEGVPYYQLTPRGLLVSMSLDEVIEKENILKEFFAKSELGEKLMQDAITKFSKIAPKFTHSIFKEYVKAYCEGKLKDLLPLNFANFRQVSDKSILILKEFLDAFSQLSKSDKKMAESFLEKI